MECPYCSDRLIRHIQHHEVYWFCRTCWQRIPSLDLEAVQDCSELLNHTRAGRVHRTHSRESHRTFKEFVSSVTEEVA